MDDLARGRFAGRMESVLCLGVGVTEQDHAPVFVDGAQTHSFDIDQFVNVGECTMGFAILHDEFRFAETDAIKALGYLLSACGVDIDRLGGPGRESQHAGGD